MSNIIDEVEKSLADYVVRKYKSDIKLVRYPGGDYYIFDRLNRIFMYAPNTNIFVEVFGGSCWCSLNVSRTKFKVIVCNDIDRDLINLYRLVRSNPEELVKRLSILPFSREMVDIALDVLNSKDSDPVTRAVMLFYLLRATFNGEINCGFVGVAKSRNGAVEYSRAVASIVEYAKKFRDVVLEAKDFREIIKEFDTERTLFYLDPPYVGREYYRYPFTESSLKTMATVLQKVRGYWVLKISEDNYNIIKNVLPNHSTVTLDEPLYMTNTQKEERPKHVYVIAFNYRAKT